MWSQVKKKEEEESPKSLRVITPSAPAGWVAESTGESRASMGFDH